MVAVAKSEVAHLWVVPITLVLRVGVGAKENVCDHLAALDTGCTEDLIINQDTFEQLTVGLDRPSLVKVPLSAAQRRLFAASVTSELLSRTMRLRCNLPTALSPFRRAK